jgi:AraC-like DNA-binding protein
MEPKFPDTESDPPANERKGAEPFHRFPVMRTSSLKEWERIMMETFGANSIRVPSAENVWARANFLGLTDITLGYSRSGPRCILDYGEADCARVRLVLNSSVETKSGSVRDTAYAGHPTVASPGQAVISDYGENLELMFLWINSGALLQKLTALTGLAPRRKFVFHPTEFTNPQLIGGLRVMVDSFIRYVHDPSAAVSPIAIKELEQALTVQFLLASRHNFSSYLEQEDNKFIPQHVFRAAEFIDGNWNQPITIEALVDASGVSARTLFKAFFKTHGISPMIFVKKLRLEHARRLLTTPDARTSVTGTAFACGFSNLGHFARDYQNAFGELPSQTLTRAKGEARQAPVLMAPNS